MIDRRGFLVAAASATAAMALPPTLAASAPKPMPAYPGFARFRSMMNVSYQGISLTLTDGCDLRNVIFEDCDIWLEGSIKTCGARANNCRVRQAPVQRQ